MPPTTSDGSHEPSGRNATADPETEAGLASSENPTAGGAAASSPNSTSSPRNPRNRCGVCPGCTSKADDCGHCVACLDKTRFGGPNVLRRGCMANMCTGPGPDAAVAPRVPRAPPAAAPEPTAPVKSLDELHVGQGVIANGASPGVGGWLPFRATVTGLPKARGDLCVNVRYTATLGGSTLNILMPQPTTSFVRLSDVRPLSSDGSLPPDLAALAQAECDARAEGAAGGPVSKRARKPSALFTRISSDVGIDTMFKAVSTSHRSVNPQIACDDAAAASASPGASGGGQRGGGAAGPRPALPTVRLVLRPLAPPPVPRPFPRPYPVSLAEGGDDYWEIERRLRLAEIERAAAESDLNGVAREEPKASPAAHNKASSAAHKLSPGAHKGTPAAHKESAASGRAAPLVSSIERGRKVPEVAVQWEPWEDAKLLAGVETHGSAWSMIMRESLPHRNNDMIRNRHKRIRQLADIGEYDYPHKALADAPPPPFHMSPARMALDPTAPPAAHVPMAPAPKAPVPMAPAPKALGSAAPTAPTEPTARVSKAVGPQKPIGSPPASVASKARATIPHASGQPASGHGHGHGSWTQGSPLGTTSSSDALESELDRLLREATSEQEAAQITEAFAPLEGRARDRAIRRLLDRHAKPFVEQGDAKPRAHANLANPPPAGRASKPPTHAAADAGIGTAASAPDLLGGTRPQAEAGAVDEERVRVVHVALGTIRGGKSAPRRSNFSEWLKRNPEWAEADVTGRPIGAPAPPAASSAQAPIAVTMDTEIDLTANDAPLAADDDSTRTNAVRLGTPNAARTLQPLTPKPGTPLVAAGTRPRAAFHTPTDGGVRSASAPWRSAEYEVRISP